MPPKQKIPAPIDRPLSRAYLREFSGWSTEFPPGLSDPTSLRQMENVLVNRDGSARVRPGLRYLSYLELPVEGGAVGVPIDQAPVSSHEAFYLNDGSRAYLFAVREDDGTVGFRVMANTGLGFVVHGLTDPGIEFDVDAGLNFSAGTRYVKFLQIDNKIFALSSGDEPMREFFVGADKHAVVLKSITRPEWTVADKLDVVHPDASWIDSGVPVAIRTNHFTFPSFEAALTAEDTFGRKLQFGTYTEAERSSDFSRSGGHSLKLTSKPERTNINRQPLHDVNTTGVGSWVADEPSDYTVDAHAATNSLRLLDNSGAYGSRVYARSPMMDVEEGKTYKVAFDVVDGVFQKTGIAYRWFDSAGVGLAPKADKGWSATGLPPFRRTITTPEVPEGAAKLRIFLGVEHLDLGGGGSNLASGFFRDVVVVEASEATTALDGDAGADYYWTGDVNDSPSVYHPPQTVSVSMDTDVDPTNTSISAYFRAGTVGRDVYLDAGGSDAPHAGGTDVAGAWTRSDFDATFLSAPTLEFTLMTLAVENVPRGEYHYIDDVLVEHVPAVDSFFDGNTAPVVGFVYEWVGDSNKSKSKETEYTAPLTVPVAETKNADTLIADAATGGNDYSFGFFYTFSNEIGESAASQARIVRAQRSWSEWSWKPPTATGEPDDAANDVGDPALAADQLVAVMPEEVFNYGVSVGAIKWTLYMFTWSNQDPVPVSALKVGERRLDTETPPVHAEVGWIRVTPAQSDYGTEANVLPSEANRYNASDPSHAGQGIVAADRMVLVLDPARAAVIRWSSNQQGAYTDFSPSKGGGFKTLTHGNLQVPACVKLWQNPESKDTLTILTLGTDGYSTGYYMAPAQVASQSEATNIMAFEETTATPGTTSPYGCEVVNNSLYHPLDEQLMKSTASNYNINHKAVTDQIQSKWRDLIAKEWIISSVHDNRIYYLVNNPDGFELEEGCNGNELWVFDAQSEGGTWSRFLIQAVSLRKLERGGRVYMSVVRPDGIYYLDDDYSFDDYVAGGEVSSRSIPWLLETNTQGANKAHDAWCHLRQAELTLGNFSGRVRWGVRGWDVNGKVIERSKIFDYDAGEDRSLTWDIQDQLRIAREMREWFFFAESVTDDAEVVEHSEGQISLVQYRYAPVSVNVGYEYGSIETFEYARATANRSGELTNAGVPIPFNDQRRP